MSHAEVARAQPAGPRPYGAEVPGAGLSGAGYPAERVSLVDLLDRVLAGGVVVTGEITLSIADVDLVVVSLRALIASASALARPAKALTVLPGEPGGGVSR